MQKLNGESKNIVEENIEKLKQIFPEAFSEGKVQLEVLEELLGEYKETEKERYDFTWAGKQQARLEAQKVSTGTLRPCPEESVNFDTTENLYIEGDNLEVLKLLQKSYHNKVKMIYIDPPYNTGKDFVYKDDYHDNLKNYQELTGQTDSEGNRLSTNSETAGRFHSNWLNMMYPRLKLARNLLRDDGVIFISIDDHEVHNLRKICDEIFGEENLRNCFISRRYDKNLNRQFMDSGLKSFNTGFEYILCYSKFSSFSFNPVFKETSEERANSGYWKGFWNAPDRPTMRYDILGFTPTTGQWKWKKETALEAVKNYEKYCNEFSDKMSIEEYWKSTGKVLKFIRRNINGKGQNNGVENWIAPSTGILRNTNLLDILSSQNTEETKGLFEFPKNPQLIKTLIEMGSTNNDIILDFFSGSSTTAHAVLDLNKEDGGNRKYIMVQLPEPTDEKSEAYKAGYKTIADIGKERIRRAAKKIAKEVKSEKGKVQQEQEDKPLYSKMETGAPEGSVNKLDLGFKVFKLDSSNIKAWDPQPEDLDEQLEYSISNVKEDRSEADLLYEILLKMGLDLSVPIEKITTIGKNAAGGFIYNIGKGALIVCLQDDIGMEVVEQIGKLKEELEPEVCRVVFKDSCFQNDVVKTNALQVLKGYGVEEVRSV